MNISECSGGDKPICFLVDNGSLRAEATLSLRALAQKLSKQLGETVLPVSLLHAHKVDPELLGGEPATIFIRAMKAHLKAGVREFWILPLFFGPSRAITEYLPEQVALLKADYPELIVRVAPFLAEESMKGDDLLCAALLKSVEEAVRENEGGVQQVILVDHGTPAPEVNAVRNRLGRLLSDALRGRVNAFSVASMERREGSDYDFNEPLLESVLRLAAFKKGTTLVALLFLNPGRHAGPGGDIEQICQKAAAEQPGQRIVMGKLLGDAPEIVDILADRYLRVSDLR